MPSPLSTSILTSAPAGINAWWNGSGFEKLSLPIVILAVVTAVVFSATLTDAQAADLQGGRWYINIHTNANRGGEIRGQVVK